MQLRDFAFVVAVGLATVAVPVAAQQFTEIRLDPAPPATLAPGDRVTVDFRYTTPPGAAVRVFVRPLTASQLTADYAASDSPEYEPGDGSGDGWFTIENGPAQVESVRVQMVDAESLNVLYERVVAAEYRFEAPEAEPALPVPSARPQLGEPLLDAPTIYDGVELPSDLIESLGEYRPPAWRLPPDAIQAREEAPEIPSCESAGIEADSCDRVVGRRITEAGAVVIDCGDGSTWRTATAHGEVYTAPDGRSCRRVVMMPMSGTAFPPLEPPPATIRSVQWVEDVNRWLERTVAESLLSRIESLVGERYVEYYLTVEERNTADIYDRIDHRLSYLDKLLQSL